MNQWLVVFLGALAVAAIVIGIATVYTNSTASRMPERSEFIQGVRVAKRKRWGRLSGYVNLCWSLCYAKVAKCVINRHI